jgi:hypothetical protein
MDEFDVEDMLEELREETAAAIGVMTACLTNAVNAQPNIDNLKFTHDLIAHLDKSSSLSGISGIAAAQFRDILQNTLDQALKRAGIAP